jgi:hypothetical protein
LILIIWLIFDKVVNGVAIKAPPNTTMEQLQTTSNDRIEEAAALNYGLGYLLKVDSILFWYSNG